MYLLQIIQIIFPVPFRILFAFQQYPRKIPQLMGLGTKYLHKRPSLINRYLSKQWIDQDNSIIISQSNSCYVSTYLLSFTYLNLTISGIFSFHLWITFHIKSAFDSPRVDWILAQINQVYHICASTCLSLAGRLVRSFSTKMINYVYPIKLEDTVL